MNHPQPYPTPPSPAVLAFVKALARRAAAVDDAREQAEQTAHTGIKS